MRKSICLFLAGVFLFVAVFLGGLAAVYRGPYASPIVEAAFLARNPQVGWLAAPVLEAYKDAYTRSALFTGGDVLMLTRSGVLVPFGAVAGLALVLAGLAFAARGRGGAKRVAAKPAPKKKIAVRKKAAAAAGGQGGAAAAVPAAAAGGGEAVPAAGGGGEAAPAAAGGVASAPVAVDLDALLGGDEEDEAVAAAGGGGKRSFGGRTFFVPDEMLGEEFENRAVFYNIKSVVAMRQASLSEGQCRVIWHVLYPDFLPYWDRLGEEVRVGVTRQALLHHMLRLGREEKDISADQFVIQDRRMGEAERETICRRFAPKNPAVLDDNARALVGKVYTVMEQGRAQQMTDSQAEDWQDISLRNLTAVMESPVAGGGGA